MKSLQDYQQTTSPYELFEHLYNKVITRTITSFTQLMDYVRYLPGNKSTLRVYRKIFHLIKELNWGVFAPVDPKEYPALWKELVIPFQGIPGTGDLKRNTSISSVYAAILDIHGYSAFCLRHRRNLSMLQLLDECIQSDIRRITRNFDTLSWRTEGDTIILVAADAVSITSSAVNIIDYFSRRRIIKSKKLQQSKVVNKIILPDMAVSAGIAGGRTYTPLVITQDGDISGDIINTAARLQNFANTLDPKETRVLLSNHVVHQLQKKKPGKQTGLLEAVDYFNLGRFQFKGMEITVFEILFKEAQKEKLVYQKSFLKLYSALEKGRWRDMIFESLIGAIAAVLRAAGPQRINEKSRGELLNKCSKALKLYNSGTDYKQPVALLEELYENLPRVKNMDPVLLLYAQQILEKYKLLANLFYQQLESNFHGMLNKFLTLQQRDLFLKAEKSMAVYRQLKDIGLNEMMKENQKYSWFRIIDEERDFLNTRIHVGKK